MRVRLCAADAGELWKLLNFSMRLRAAYELALIFKSIHHFLFEFEAL